MKDRVRPQKLPFEVLSFPDGDALNLHGN